MERESSAPETAQRVHVLVVDDEVRVRRMLADYLEEQGIKVSLAASGRDLWAAVEQGGIDVVLLDLVLANEDGLALARELRQRSNVAIIMLTGRVDVVDRVVGLEVGADDYLTKPFHLREVLARIKSVLRRTRPAAPPPAAAQPGEEILRFAGYALHLGGRRLIDASGKEIPLTTGEFNLLLALAQRPQRVVDRDTLMDLAKGRQWEAYDRSIDSQVARLRKKIEPDPASPTLIRSVRGAGYLFAAAVERA